MSAEDKPQTETIATLRIDLIDSDPPIWREIEVPVAMTLKQLHGIIQAAMDWEDAHLWEFTLGRERIGSSRAARLTLQDLLRPRTTRLDYTYDMGDCWEHQLTLTKPRPADPNHPDHDDAKDWYGDYDPNRLDEQPIKNRLARIANRRRTTPTKTKPR